MSEKRFLHPVDKMGKLIEVIEYTSISRYGNETLSTKICATNFLLTCLVDYTIGERIKYTLNTQQNSTQQEVQRICFLNMHRN